MHRRTGLNRRMFGRIIRRIVSQTLKTPTVGCPFKRRAETRVLAATIATAMVQIAATPHGATLPGDGVFIVAFNIPAENGFDFVWPHDAMPPAAYETVVMLIDRMPQVRNPLIQGQDWHPVSPVPYLTVNGAALKPIRTKPAWFGPGKVQGLVFLVPLQAGRIHFALSIPKGWLVHPKHNRVEIRLYEADEN